MTSDPAHRPIPAATITALTCYPVKGCAGVSTPHAVLTPAGLAHDRSFMVVDHKGAFRSQRRDPRLALIRPRVDADGARLALSAPGVDAVDVPVTLDAPRRGVRLFANHYQGIDQGDAAAAWLTRVLGKPSRLVRVPPEHDRVTDGETPGTSGYADSCPVHLISQSSLDLLNEQIAAHGGPPVSSDRFRPNIVVAGWVRPHTEDQVRRVTVGEAELRYAKVAIRCAVTTVDQESGVRGGPEPLRTLARYRRRADGLAFGVKLAVTRPGRLALGDALIVEAAASVADHLAVPRSGARPTFAGGED